MSGRWSCGRMELVKYMKYIDIIFINKHLHIMKPVLFTFILGFISCSLHAQQDFLGRNPIVSHEIHTDHTVT
jgi:hypothetical protein